MSKRRHFRPHEHVLGKEVSRTRGVVVLLFLIFVFCLGLELVMGWYNALYIYPRPALVVSNLVSFFANEPWMEHLAASTRRVYVGTFVGGSVGFCLACLLLVSPFGRFSLNFLGAILYGFPRVAIFFLALAIMGIGEDTKYFVSLYIAFFVQLVFVARGSYELFNVERDMWADLSVLGPSRWRALRDYMVPMLVPEFFTGLMFGSALNWTMLLLSENAGAYRGLGVMFHRELNAIDTSGAIGFGIVISICALATHVLIALVRELMARYLRV